MIFFIIGQIFLFTASNMKTRIGPVGNMLITSGFYFLSLLYCVDIQLIGLNYSSIFVILLFQGLYIILYSGLYKSISVKMILEFHTLSKINEKILKENMNFDEIFIDRIKALRESKYFILENQEFTLSRKGKHISEIYILLRRVFLSKYEI